jgi:hypothetical protein
VSASFAKAEVVMIVLDIACFAVKGVRWKEVAEAYLWGANYALAGFDMKVVPNPRLCDEQPYMLEMPDRPYQVTKRDAGRLREACHRALPVGRGVPVIFCRFDGGGGGNTILRGDKEANGDIDWYPYIMIHTGGVNTQKEVLIHELIHTTGYQGDADPYGHDKDPGSVMSKVPLEGPRTSMVTMQEKHAVLLRKVYFARAV